MLHSKIQGVFKKLKIQRNLPKPMRLISYIEPGAKILPFEHGGNSFGNTIWKFKSIEELIKFDEKVRADRILKIEYEKN